MMIPYTPDAVKTIRRNAGLVPPAEIAAALDWPLAQLERIAARHFISLDMIAMPVISDEKPQRPRRPRSECRTETIRVHLRFGDAEILRAKAAARFVKPARLLAAVFEGAISHGKIDLLANAAAFYRPGDAEIIEKESKPSVGVES